MSAIWRFKLGAHPFLIMLCCFLSRLTDPCEFCVYKVVAAHLCRQNIRNICLKYPQPASCIDPLYLYFWVVCFASICLGQIQCLREVMLALPSRSVGRHARETVREKKALWLTDSLTYTPLFLLPWFSRFSDGVCFYRATQERLSMGCEYWALIFREWLMKWLLWALCCVEGEKVHAF